MTDVPANVKMRTSLAREYDGYSLTDADMFRSLSLAEDRHFWHLTRNRFIADRLARLPLEPGARILELGCGGGCVAAHLSKLGYDVTGVDGHLPRILEAAARAPSARFIVEDLARTGALAEETDFDAVALFDVLEHLDDPRAALQAALEHVRPDGFVVGTVPALKSLWSDADRRAGHRLRYDRDSLRSLLGPVVGAAIVEIEPFNRILVPLVWLQRRLARGSAADSGDQYYRVPWGPVNRALHFLLRMEHRVSAGMPWAARLPGASLWFVLRKPQARVPLAETHSGRVER
jgi:SAM-dependent methyltransferase